jgi:ABC-2 type transport system permease protein
MSLMQAPGNVITSPLWLLWQVHLRQNWRRILAIRQQSRLLSALIIVFLGGYFTLAYWLFWKGLSFIATFPGLGSLITERLLFLLFFFLFVLLWFSCLVICYTNLFRNRETHHLLSLPMEHRSIYQWKFLESVLLASWAFIFLAAPLLIAYGITSHVPWHFFMVMPCLVAAFIVLPAVGGSWCAIQIARFLDRRNFQWIVLAVFAVLLLLIALAFKPQSVSEEGLETRVLEVLDRLLVKTRFAQYPLLPSYWLCSAILFWSEGALATAIFFSLVLLSYMLFFGFSSFLASDRIFYDGVSAVQSRPGQLSWRLLFNVATSFQPRDRLRPGWLERSMQSIPWLSMDLQALVVKDLRLFWRDTTQWGQTLMLFGLLCAYIINLRHFSHQFQNPFWINLVSFLNLLACTLNLATITTRFVFPQFSQEGKRLWIIGMAPVGIHMIIKFKYIIALTASLAITMTMMVLSCWMLQISWSRTLFFVGADAIMAFTLTGMALGLGTLYPNFKEDNPSKIVSGFGGTLCLILSFLYIVGSVALLSLTSSWGHRESRLMHHHVIIWLVFLGWSWLLGWLPYRLGLVRLRDVEWMGTN